MALSCAAVMRDSVSLLRFPLLSHDQVFTCAISAVCRLKYPYSCFSSHLCFLVFVVFLLVHMLMLLFLAAVISLSLLFCVYSSSAWIVESTQSSMLTRPPFLRRIVCLCRSSGVAPCALSSVSLFFGPSVVVPLLSTLRMVQST